MTARPASRADDDERLDLAAWHQLEPQLHARLDQNTLADAAPPTAVVDVGEIASSNSGTATGR